MPFLQPAPELGNQCDDDAALRSLLRRALPADVLAAVEPELREMGALAGGELYRMQLDGRLDEPRLTQWSPWGERIDRIELTPLWREAERIAAGLRHPLPQEAMETARDAIDHAVAWLEEVEWQGGERHLLEAGARRFALTVGRVLEVALLAAHAQWAIDEEHDHRPATVALRLAASGINRISPLRPRLDWTLARGVAE